VARATVAVSSGAASGFIASRWYDGICFILAPLLALAFVHGVSGWSWSLAPRNILGVQKAPLAFGVAVWTYAHLTAVMFRSHVNPEIFARHRFRFVVVPIALFATVMVSDWAMIGGLVVLVFWDIYHTSMQNFGLCRIYDARLGNQPEEGRLLDVWMNHVLYIGPILAGASLFKTLVVLRSFGILGWREPGRWLIAIGAWQVVIRWTVIALGTAFVVFYVAWYWRRVRRGYRFSPQKAALLASVAIVSIGAWGFLPAWEAFLVANVFHGLQYFAIVWWIEKANIRRAFGLARAPLGHVLAFAAFALSVAVVGVGYELYGDHRTLRWAGAMAVVISAMHFWYDGFVWSVRRREI
jgi:hypothetical protein